ncbi:MAG: ATP-binding protein [Bacteroidia bacterium]|nr:ATP-binding protein [Bacteroidia bacterium]
MILHAPYDTATVTTATRALADWHYTPYLLISAAAAIISFGVAMYVYRRRTAPGGLHFTLLMCAVGFWALTNTFEFLSQTIWLKILWSKISYLGILSIPQLWLLFALSYAHPESRWIGRRSILLWIVPVVLMLLTATNEQHGLVWPQVLPFQSEPNLLVRYEHGPVFWLAVGWIYLHLFLGTVLLFRAVVRSEQLYRMQIALLLLAMSLPWLGNVLYITRLVRWADQDLTPIAFALSGIAVALGMFRYHMLDIVPVARSTTIERMTDGVLVLDAFDRVVDVNPAALAVLQRDDRPIIGMRIDQLSAIPADVLDEFRDAAEAQAEVCIEEQYWYDVRVSTLHGKKNRQRGRLVVFRDISARKLAELELKRYAEELEAGNAELDAFAHTVAHDLRAPLSVVIGFSDSLQNLRDLLSDEEVREHLSFISGAGKKMQGIIDALLLLANVRRNSDVPISVLDMPSIITDVLSSHAERIRGRNADVSGFDQCPEVLGHTVWIENVWSNYLGNALKYGNTADGKRMEIRLGWDNVASPGSEGSMIRFWVRDNGKGLNEGERARLFTPFTRLHLDEAEGHGLGLSIVERIVKRLGGDVGVESTVGEGCLFWFTLPQADAASHPLS